MLCAKDFAQDRRSVPHRRLVAEYLDAAAHGQEMEGPLFRRVRPPKAGQPAGALTPGSVCADMVVFYMKQVWITGKNMGLHALRVTAVSGALEHNDDINRGVWPIFSFDDQSLTGC